MLPIRKIYFNTTQSDRVVLLSRAKDLYNNLLNNFNPKNHKALLEFVEKRLHKDKNGNFQKDKKESDVISDFLAFLAEKIIEMNKKKNNEIRGFIE